MAYTVSVMPSFQLGRANQMQVYYIVDNEEQCVKVTSHVEYEQQVSDRYAVYTVNGDLKSRKIVAIAYCIAEIYTKEDGEDVDKNTLQNVISTFSKSLIGKIDVTYDLKEGSRTINTFRDLKSASEMFTKLTESIPDKDYRIYEVRTYSHLESEKVI